jgi:hypothetical protein
MTNSYGFNGSVPDGAVAGVYDSENGEWTGDFFFTVKEAEEAEKELMDNDALSMESVNDSGWIGAK